MPLRQRVAHMPPEGRQEVIAESTEPFHSRVAPTWFPRLRRDITWPLSDPASAKSRDMGRALHGSHFAAGRPGVTDCRSASARAHAARKAPERPRSRASSSAPSSLGCSAEGLDTERLAPSSTAAASGLEADRREALFFRRPRRTHLCQRRSESGAHFFLFACAALTVGLSYLAAAKGAGQLVGGTQAAPIAEGAQSPDQPGSGDRLGPPPESARERATRWTSFVSARICRERSSSSTFCLSSS